MPNDVEVKHHPDRLVVDVERSRFGREPVTFQSYRQSTQWHEVMIAGPVANCTGRTGNAFPGMYYWHPTERRQWVVMADGPVDWRECRLGVRPRTGALELGLFSTGRVEPDVRLRVWNAPLDEAPSQWRALETLVTTSFELCPLPKPTEITPQWHALAARCLRGLGLKKVLHPLARRVGGVAFHSMLDSHHDIYGRQQAYLELICQAGIARALHRYPVGAGVAIARRIAADMIPRFFDPGHQIFHNAYHGADELGWPETVETWYTLSNLSDVLHLAAAFPDLDGLRQQAGSAAARMMTIGRAFGHVFPLFLDVTTRERGNNNNVAAAGLYADVMLAAARLFPDGAGELRAEAAQALTVLHRLPLAQMFHQPELLARAAESAFELGADDGVFERMGEDFLHAMLLMQYRDEVNGGLFEGAAGMMYPTFRESAQALTSLGAMAARVPALPVPGICALGLTRSFRFLEDHAMNTVFPREGLATREVPGGGKVGTAVYAAGGVFDLARLQKTLDGC